MRISDWSSDVCSSDLEGQRRVEIALGRRAFAAPDGRDSAVALRGRGHRPAYRLRILRCQIARYAEESMFGRRIHDRQLSPEQMVAAIRIDLVHHLDQRIVARDQYARSEERRVGTEGVSTCRFRGAPYQ